MYKNRENENPMFKFLKIEQKTVISQINDADQRAASRAGGRAARAGRGPPSPSHRPARAAGTSRRRGAPGGGRTPPSEGPRYA